MRRPCERRYEGVITECRRRAGAIRSGCASQQSGREPQQPARSYFFLRRQLGKDYLTLLQFFLNHRRYLRSEDPSRVGKSPAELLTGEPTLTGWSFWGTRGSRGTEAPARQPGTRVNPLQRADRSGSALRSQVLPENGVLEPCQTGSTIASIA